MAKCSIVVLVVVGVIGLIFVAVGGGLIPYLNAKIDSTVKSNVMLVNNSEGYKNWLAPPAPIFLDFYFFDVINADAIVNNGSKPHVVERGPYVYREVREKEEVKFLNGTSRLRYKEKKFYVFDKHRSNGSEDDNITSVNLVAVTIVFKLGNFQSNTSWINKLIADLFEKLGLTLFDTHTIGQLLWGYTPDIVKRWNKMVKWPLPQLNLTVGLYTGKMANGTDNGNFTIFTGTNDIAELAVVDSWNGAKNLTYWTTAECNMINGTDGTLWHPFIKKTDTLYIFNTDLCRSIYVTYSADTTVSSSNIPLYRFTVPPMVMANDTVNPHNKGFCTPDCLGTGVLDVSVCRDAPIVMSQPHFFEADEKYQKAIAGLNPRDVDHQTFVDVEPTTGVVFNAAKKVQVNLLVKKRDYFGPTLKLAHDYVFPLMWANEHGMIDDNDASKFHSEVIVPMMISQGVEYGFIALGGFLILIVVIIFIVIVRRRHATEIETSDDDEPLLTNAG